MTQEIINALAGFQITGKQATSLALNELHGWQPDDVIAVLCERVTRPSLDYKPLTVNSPSIASPELVMSPWEMVKNSAKEGLALFVNKQSEFRMLRSGYMAISHVWSEGIQLNETSKGISRTQLLRIFSAIHLTKAEWIWLDVLAIPGGGGPVNAVEEDLIKIDLINTMADIYERADAVVVLDALLLQMHSLSPLDVGVGIVCGKWVTRLWTYQEIKLARKALIVTQTQVFDFRGLVEALGLLSKSDQRVGSMFKSLRVLQRDDTLGISLPDVAMACQNRTTGNDVDYARAFFPLLRLQWKHGLSREQGMEKIYASQPRHATRLVAMHGSSRLGSSPGWAPSRLTGLEGRIEPPSEWEKRGIRGQWFSLRVEDVIKELGLYKGKQRLQLQLYNHDGLRSWGHCILAEDEPQATLDAFIKSVREGTALILCKSHLSPECPSKFAETVLFAEKVVEGLDLSSEREVYVHCTAAFTYINGSCPSKQQSWLLRHENPTQLLWGTGKYIGDVLYRLNKHEHENALHLAVRNGDVRAVRDLLHQGVSPNVKDSKHWTPLHTAASLGHAEIARILLEYGSDIEAVEEGGMTIYGRTPLLIAAEKGQASVVDVLLKAKADINANKRYLTPLGAAAWGGNTKVVEQLILAGADVNWSDESGFTPLLLAADHRHVVCMRKLLQHGAHIEGRHVNGLTPLHRASKHGLTEAIELLLDAGANIEAKEACDWTPIRHATQEQQVDAVRILLQRGANPNPVYRGEWRPIMIAAYLGNHEITQLLLNAGADVNVWSDPEGFTPLHWAAKYGNALVLKMILHAGGEINARDSSGHTPLQVAIEHNHQKVVKVLRDAGGLV